MINFYVQKDYLNNAAMNDIIHEDAEGEAAASSWGPARRRPGGTGALGTEKSQSSGGAVQG